LPMSSARYHFVPTAAAISTPAQASASAWDLIQGPPVEPGLLAPWNVDPAPGGLVATAASNPLSGHTAAAPAACIPLSTPPERFTPAFADRVAQLRAWQVAYFRRGDSARFVMAVDATGDTAITRLVGSTHGAPEQGALLAFWGIPSDGLPRDSARGIVQRTDPRGRWLASMGAPWDTMVVGIEMLLPANVEPDDRVRASALIRTRLSVAPPSEPVQRVGLSDIALYDASHGAPAGLDGVGSVLPMMLGTTTLESGARSPVGLFWEVYGMRPNENCSVTLSVIPEEAGQGLAARVLALFRSSSAPVHLLWQDQTPAGANADSIARAWARSVSVQLGALPPGRYQIRLTLGVAGQQSVSVVRPLVIVRSGT